ncbi:MAG: hypothetical protein ACUVWO_14195 [Thermodesulfobacteriota bacterium]
MGNADLAQIPAASNADLKRITINKFDHRVCGNNNISLIYVCNNVTMRVNNLKGSSQIPCSINKKSPISLRKELLAVGRAVKLVDRLKPRNLRHQEPANRGPPGHNASWQQATPQHF